MNKSDTWIEVTIPVDVYSAEAMVNYLFEQGCLGVEEVQEAVKGYFPDTCSFKNPIVYLRISCKRSCVTS